jgi:predicted nucleic acid-binding protein
LLSALGIKLRSNQLTEADAHDVVDTYSRLVSPHLHRISVEDADHRQAVILLEGWRTALRAGDGLHLAIALAHGATVFTFDRGMAEAGAALGIPVKLLA